MIYKKVESSKALGKGYEVVQYRYTSTYGTYYYLDGLLHHEDSPAAIYTNGSAVGGFYRNFVIFKAWFIKGKRHRIDGPAVEADNGHKEWWVDDKRHRIDGPAIVDHLGTKYWYIEGIEYTEEEFNKVIASMKESNQLNNFDKYFSTKKIFYSEYGDFEELVKELTGKPFELLESPNDTSHKVNVDTSPISPEDIAEVEKSLNAGGIECYSLPALCNYLRHKYGLPEGEYIIHVSW